MKNVIQRADFQHWLDNGTAPLVIAHSKDETATILKIAKTPEIDYLYGTSSYCTERISWCDKLAFCGTYDQRSQKLYLADDPLTGVVEGITEEERQARGAYAKEIQDGINGRVEAILGNDRRNLTVTEVADRQEVRDLKYYLEHGAREDAVRRFFEDRAPDGQFHSEYELNDLPEKTFIVWLQDPEQFVQSEAERYINSHQEHLLAEFLKDEALLSEYQALIADRENPVHRMKAITNAVKGCGARTVTVTIRKDGEKLTFKTEAPYLLGNRNYYSTSGIPAQDRRRFEEAFGRHSDYHAEDITKITYGRNTIYEAPSAQTEEMGQTMQLGMSL